MINIKIIFKKLNQLKDKNISYIGEVSLTKDLAFSNHVQYLYCLLSENFGNAILEALHAGLPVITTKNTLGQLLRKIFAVK